MPNGSQLKEYLLVAKHFPDQLLHISQHMHLKSFAMYNLLVYSYLKNLRKYTSDCMQVWDAFDNLIWKKMWIQKETDRMCRTQLANKGVYLNSYKLKVFTSLIRIPQCCCCYQKILEDDNSLLNFSLKSFHLTNCPERFLYFNNVPF